MRNTSIVGGDFINNCIVIKLDDYDTEISVINRKMGKINIIDNFEIEIGIKHLTVYAFSTENWKRSQEEVGAIMKLLKFYLLDFFNWSDENIKINVLGRIAELPKDLKDQIHKIEEKTKNNTGLVLNICFNYGGRDEIVTATKNIVQKVLDGELKIEDINEKLFSNYLYTANQPDPDL